MVVGDAAEFDAEKARGSVSEAVRGNLARGELSAITRPRVGKEIQSTPLPPQQFPLAEPLTEPLEVPLAVPLEVAT